MLDIVVLLATALLLSLLLRRAGAGLRVSAALPLGGLVGVMAERVGRVPFLWAVVLLVAGIVVGVVYENDFQRRYGGRH